VDRPARSQTEDAALMHALGQGDAAAYRALSAAYLQRVVNYAQRLLANAAEAEDVTQEVFLRLWQGARTWEPNALVVTWLFRVAHNLCVDRLRRADRYSEDEAEAGTDSHRPSRLLERRELSEAVQRAVDGLPARQRAALLLSHYEGLGNPEIAAILELGVEAVESLLARARRRLREVLVEYQRSGS
jgi:RNA polymerase sigma-70 factor, ECF subfamily